MASNSNACIPPAYPVTVIAPPLPSTLRGEPTPLDGDSGRLNAGKQILSYPSGKLAIIRSLDGQELPNSKLPVLCYRGHPHATSSVKLSTSGAYAASGDTRGKLRVWALDHEEHLCKLDVQVLTSNVRDIAWDGESKRIAVAGDRLDGRSECTKALQWDTGVTQGTLSQHVKGTCCAIAFKPNRPFRVVSAGKEDGKVHFHKGPPFSKMPVENGVPSETQHSKGINCVRYTADGELVASVGGDKSVCIYEGKNLEFKSKLENVHTGTIYACAWDGAGEHLMTASADGTCKLFAVSKDGSSITEKHVWKVAEHQLGKSAEKCPKGGLQLGCAFVGGTIPVSVSTNNQLAILPMPGSGSDAIEIVTGHNAPIGGVAFDHDNGVFFTGDSDGIICKWDMKECKALERIQPDDNSDLTYVVHGGAINGMAMTDGGTLASIGWDDTAHFTSKDGKLQTSKKTPTHAQPSGIATGTKITAIITVKGVLLLKDGKPLNSELVSLSYEANCVAVSKDDLTVYIGGADCKIYVYDVAGETLNESQVIEGGHLKPVTALAISNDGTMLAAGDARDVCVYDRDDSYKPIVGKSRWCFHLQKVLCLAWSPDDKVLASGGADDSMYLWCLEKKMKRLHYQYAHRGGVVGMTFRKDVGDKLVIVSAGVDSCIVQWDVTDNVKDKGFY